MVGVGGLHFKDPEIFASIVPDYLPWPVALVYISGVFEILGGIGLMVPRVSRWAAWGLIALYIAVFPANLHMAIHNIPIRGETLSNSELGQAAASIRLDRMGVLVPSLRPGTATPKEM